MSQDSNTINNSRCIYILQFDISKLKIQQVKLLAANHNNIVMRRSLEMPQIQTLTIVGKTLLC